MRKYLLTLFLLFYSIISALGQANEIQKKIKFYPAEIQTLFLFYNGTKIKGSDVELFAPIGLKLREGFKQAQNIKDSTSTISLNLTLNEIGICFNIIQNSTFEAKYAPLILQLKEKLRSYLPVAPGVKQNTKKMTNKKK